VVFAVGALLASIWVEGGGLGAATVGSLLVQIGDLAFGGFAQLTGPVALALYWRGTTRTGMYAGVLSAQALYLAFNVLPPIDLGAVQLFATTYFGWGVSLYLIALGTLVTVAASVLTEPAPGARPAVVEVRR
jgi:SSS family solute:Na+ symporter